MNKRDQEAIQKGVTDSWDFWLRHNESVLGSMIDMAVENSVSRWLDDHSDEIIERITGPTSDELRSLREQARKEGRPW